MATAVALLAAVPGAQAMPINVTPPAISGAPEVGTTLTASTGTWRDPSAPIVRYEYSWLRCVQYVCTFIEGADSPRLTLTPSLDGEEVEVVVAAIDELGEAESAASGPTFLITYDGPRYPVAESVTGSGFVRGFAAGRADTTLGCPGECGGYPYMPGTAIELVAEPDLGATFLGWGGACSGTTPICSFTASASVSVSARFTSLPVPTPPEGSSGEGSLGSTADAGSTALGGAPAPGEEAAAPTGGQAPARLVSLRARRGRVEAVAACERASACRLSLAVLSGRHTLARQAFTAPAWSSVGVTLALDGAGARLLARHHRLPVTARLALSSGGRWATVASRRLTLAEATASPKASAKPSAEHLSLSGTRAVRAGQEARLRASLSWPALCALSLDGHTLSRTSGIVRAVEWSWRVPPLHPHDWRLLVSCGQARAPFSMRVLGAADPLGAARLAVRVSGTPPDPPREPSEAPALGAASGQEGTVACTDAWTCPPPAAPSMPPADQFFSLAVGSCAEWAGYKRPDIYFNQSPSDPLAQEGEWDGWTWAEHAEAEGISVGSTPQTGGLAVWAPDAGGAGPSGHVAYVEGVSGEDVTLSEMNAPFDAVTRQTPEGYPYYERTVPVSTLLSEGVQFVA